MDLYTTAELNIGKDSGVIFTKLPKPKLEIPELIPVEDVPQQIFSPEEAMFRLFEQFLERKGLQRTTEYDPEQDQTYNEEDDDDDFFHPIDTESLVRDDILENELPERLDTNSDIQPITELQTAESDQMADKPQTTGLRDTDPEENEPEPTLKGGTE